MIKIPIYSPTNISEMKGDNALFSDYKTCDGYLSMIVNIVPIFDDETGEYHSEIVTSYGTFLSPLSPKEIMFF